MPADNTITSTLAIEYGESTLTIYRNDEPVWTHKIQFAGVEWAIYISAWLRYKHDLLVGKPMAERIVMDIGSAMPLEDERTMPVKGRSQLTGLPDTLDISSIDVRAEIQHSLHALASQLKWLTRQFTYSPPQLEMNLIPEEVLPALRNTPIVITGEYAWLKGLPEYLEQEVGFKFIRAEPQE